MTATRRAPRTRKPTPELVQGVRLRAELAVISARLDAAEDLPLPPHVRAIVVDCRRLFDMHSECDQSAALAARTIATLRDNCRKFQRDNERLIGQNLELCTILEGSRRRKDEDR